MENVSFNFSPMIIIYLIAIGIINKWIKKKFKRYLNSKQGKIKTQKAVNITGLIKIRICTYRSFFLTIRTSLDKF